MDDQHYRRGMGLPYDRELYLLEAANGIGTRESDTPTAAETGFDGGLQDLYEAKYEFQHVNDDRLIDIQGEVSAIVQGGITERDEGRLAYLEAKRQVLSEERELDLLSDQFPSAKEVLQGWLADELEKRQAAGQQIDNKLEAEQELLAEMVDQAEQDEDTDEIFDLAREFLAVLKAQDQLRNVVDELGDEAEEAEQEYTLPVEARRHYATAA